MFSDGKVVVFFYSFVAIFGQKFGSFSPKNCGNYFLSKSVFGYFKPEKKKITKTVPMATKLEKGGGKALVAGPLKKNFFCGSPNATWKQVSE